MKCNKPSHAFLLILGLLLLGMPQLQAQVVDYPPDELLIKFSAQAKTTYKQDFTKQLQVRKANRLGSSQAEHWQINFPVTLQNKRYDNVDEILPYLNMLPEVAYAEPNYRIYLASSIPNDPDFDQLWGCHNTGQTKADIDAPRAWAVRDSSSSIKVAILDTGIDWTHPDLIHNVWQNLGEDADGDGTVLEWDDAQGRWFFDPDDVLDTLDTDNNGYINDFIGWDFVNNDNDPMDGDGHGTHVAGTIGATGNNGIGITGVTWDVQLMALKIFSDSAVYVGVDKAVDALEYANKMGVKLSNNSWGGGRKSQALEDAIEALNDDGHLFVAAAGNNATNTDYDAFYPASYNLDNIIAVAATDRNDQLHYESNYGRNTVDLAAPGVDIYSTLPEGGYGLKSGTSMAAPQVTGALALLWEEFPNENHLTLKNDLLAAADFKNSLNNKCLSHGRLNIGNMLNTSLGDPPQTVYTCKRDKLSGNFKVQYPQPDAAYEWDFGDGNTATGEQVQYSFATEGIYKACLTGTNAFGSDTTCYWMGVTDSIDICLRADSLELVAFYRQMDGDNWINKWDTLQPVSSWYGVTVSGCSVDSITLNSSEINGSIPDFSNLINLTYLSLKGNQLSGGIPDFSNLNNLKYLSLGGNQICGAIPDFSKLNKLESLYLHSTKLNGNIPNFSKLDSLKGLTLVHNQLSGTIPNFYAFKNLTIMNLHDNQLSGIIPDFSNLNKLKTMNFSVNQLSGSIPDFPRLDSLIYLDFTLNKLSGIIPNFTGLNNLERLKLWANELSGPIPDFSNLNKLIQLNLMSNKLSGPIPDFSGLNNLSILALKFNELSGSIPDFSELDNLGSLDLSYNKLSGIMPDFSKLDDLSFLDLSHNKLSGSITDFSEWDNLGYLDLSHNQLSGIIPSFSEQNTLTALNLNDNKLNGVLPDFSNLNNLTSIYLNNNKLTGSIPNFSALSSLKTLNIGNNALIGVIPDFSAMTSLKSLGLHANQLSGSIPNSPTLNNLSSLTINANKYLFGDLNFIINNNSTEFHYEPQDSIPTLYNYGDYGNFLSVNAGGVMDDNTYYWYKDGIHVKTRTGNNEYYPYTTGHYNCIVYNYTDPLISLCSKSIYFNELNTCEIEATFNYSNQGCVGEPLFFANTSTYAYNYIWLVNGDTISTNIDFSYAFSEANNYQVTLIASDGYCTDTYTEIITVYPHANELDMEEEAIFCESGILEAGISGLSYAWKFQNNQIGTGQTLTVDQEGVYNLTVTDACANVATATINVTIYTDCIWPGDFNKDGQVNHKDVLSLGFAYGKDGPARQNPSMAWEVQGAADWPTASYKNINDKNCDGNGDGTINEDDLEAIDRNYGERHNSGINLSASLQKQYKLKPKYENGRIKVNLEHKNGGPADLYGIGMQVEVPRRWQVDFANSQFIGNTIRYQKRRWYGGIDIAMTGTDGNNRPVQGTIFGVTVQNVPTDDPDINFYVNKATRINNNDVGVQGARTKLMLSQNDSTVLAGGGISSGNIGLFLYITPYTCEEPSSAEVTVISGTAPYTYLWSNGATDSTTTNLGSGVHYVTVTDGTGAIRIGYINAGEDPDFRITVETKDASDTLTNGAATVNILGSDSTATLLCSAATASVSWNNDRSEANITGLAKGAYSITVTSDRGCEEVRVFEVLGDRVLLQAKALLQGPFDVQSGLMHDYLREYELLPQIAPDGTPVNPLLFEQERGKKAVVDYVKIELRDPDNTSSTVAYAYGLILRDGSIVAADGHPALQFDGMPNGFYQIVLRHRNHLSVMSAEPVFLSKSLKGAIDFTLGNVLGYEPMEEVATGKFALIAGDATGDSIVDSDDRGATTNLRNQIGYLQEDCTLDGIIDSDDRGITTNNRNRFSEVP